jgi:A/G-specific adenine glycosylase
VKVAQQQIHPARLNLKLLRRRLLTWFDRHRRDLPWRHTRDPYHIWVSEVMLQQTQVATVIPYYHQFLRVFPTVQALAAAHEQHVLRQWEGLGYYRRARHLHQAARIVVAEHSGILPDEPDAWRQLPGIGRYTLGAILSQAFERRLPILEANSIRLLCRLFGVRGSPKERNVQKRLWNLAEQLLPVKRLGDFNQALMELGAMLCTSKAPRCGKCPLAPMCKARHLGMQEDLPDRKAPPTTLAVDEVAVVVRRSGKVLVGQRLDRGRWASFWEFPHAPIDSGETHRGAAMRILPALTGVAASLGRELATLTHSITRYSITMVCFEARHRKGEFQAGHYQQGLWARPAQLAQLPFSSPQRRLAQILSDNLS